MGVAVHNTCRGGAGATLAATEDIAVDGALIDVHLCACKVDVAILTATVDAAPHGEVAIALLFSDLYLRRHHIGHIAIVFIAMVGILIGRRILVGSATAGTEDVATITGLIFHVFLAAYCAADIDRGEATIVFVCCSLISKPSGFPLPVVFITC